jgi:hypothetical protein
MTREIPWPKSFSAFAAFGIVLLMVGCSSQTNREPRSADNRPPITFKTKTALYVAESDGRHVTAIEVESGRILWTKDVSKEWSDDWNHPRRGIKTMEVLSLIDDGHGNLAVILNDGKAGLINMKSGETRNPISD